MTFRSEQKIMFELVRKCHIAWYHHVMRSKLNYKEKISFQCNICGQYNNSSVADVFDREISSCANCMSNLRTRSIILIISSIFFEKSIVLTEFPINKSLLGIGLSDWHGYSDILSDKF